MKSITLETLKKNIIDGKVELFTDLKIGTVNFYHPTVRNLTTKNYTTYKLVITEFILPSTRAFFNL